MRSDAKSIRRYRPDDENELIRVWLASTIRGQSFLPEQHWRAMEPLVRRELMPVADTWVVEEDGEIAAFMSLLDNLIGGLFTRPDRQRRGFGTALIEHAHRRLDPLLVEVFEANDAAIGFYRRSGFVDHARQVDRESGLSQLILRRQRD